MVGHAPDMDGQSYIRYTEEQLAQFYASHEDALTFLSANNRGLKEKVRDQTQEIKELQERLARLEAVSSERLKIKES
jgi:phage portal protein BeeE